MRNLLFGTIIWAAFTFSGSVCAHGDHAVGAVGAALNGLEAFKHGAVIYDQLTGDAQDLSYPVLIGNAVVVVGHVYQGYIQTKKPCCQKKVATLTLPLFVAANAWGIFDLIVDGITTSEYWRRGDSVIEYAAKVLAPACMAINLYSLQKMWRNS